MDFIEKLPSSSSFDTILIIVDRLSKQAIFIPTHDTITSAELAHLFVIHVFSKHRVPSHVTSNHGSEFVSHFFCSLETTLDMRLHFTSGYSSVCCFAFLALDLLAVSTLAFAHALSASKGLQAALALAQGAQEVA